MKPEVHTALAQLRGEIDILAASVLARNRLAAPEMLTSQRLSVGSAHAAVQTLDPTAMAEVLPEPAPSPAMDLKIEPRDAIALVAPTTGASAENETGILRRLVEFAKRIMRVLRG